MAEKRSSDTGNVEGKRVRPNVEITKCVNTVRVLSADMVQKANSGHPGAPMGCAPMAHVLFGEVMKFSPHNPKWTNRDRFVLSNGHACALQYSMLHLTGYNVTLDDLKNFRQLNSRTPGHPENVSTPGIEVSTGPLGQGICNAVGMAITEKHLSAVYNREGHNIVDHFTYVICGDGCLQEGVSSEASSLAGHLGLGKLIVLYDDNLITIDGHTTLSFTEDVNKRYEAYGWQVQTVTDGSDVEQISAAVAAAKADTGRPSIIKIRTIIGTGSAAQGTHGVHGSPLGPTDLANVKAKFGFDPTQFFAVPEDVRAYYGQKVAEGIQLETEWSNAFISYSAAYPELAAEYTRQMRGGLPVGWREKLPVYTHLETKAAATRSRSEEVLNAMAVICTELMGGSADLTPSNLTSLKCSSDFQKDTPAGRYIRFGVREHGMAAICNGMFAYGGLRPYCATFLNFIGYALGAVRLSALSEFGVIYVMTHDSIGLGEDGPTHQPVETLEQLRAIPNLFTIRPADGNETSGAYAVALEHHKTPSVIALSRQAAPTVEGTAAAKVALGGYTVQELGSREGNAHPTLIIVATGTEVQLAVTTARDLVASRPSAWVRVVSMPCCELFDLQPLEYQKSVLTAGSPIVSVEAAGVLGWRKYAHVSFGLDNTFGMSAPSEKIYAHFGLTTAALAPKMQEVIAFYTPEGATQPTAPSLLDFPRFPLIKGHCHH